MIGLEPLHLQSDSANVLLRLLTGLEQFHHNLLFEVEFIKELTESGGDFDTEVTQFRRDAWGIDLSIGVGDDF